MKMKYLYQKNNKQKMNINKIVVYILFFSSLFLVACSSKHVQKKEFIRPVEFITVSTSHDQISEIYTGNIQAENGIILSFSTGGIISQINVNVGDRVVKNDLLVALDQKQTMLSVEKANSQKANLKSSLQLANSNFKRIQQLYVKDNISLNDFEIARNKLSNAKSQYDSACKEVDLLLDKKKFETIVAPISGIIAEVNVEKNETVSAGNTIIRMNGGNGFEVVVNVPDRLINKVKRGDYVDVNIPSLDNNDFKGIITEVAPNINKSTSLYELKVKLKNPSVNIREGMVAKVLFHNPRFHQSSIKIPITSVIELNKRHYVFKLEPINDSIAVAHLSAITIGEYFNQGIQVKEGLKEEELIATAGLRTLMDEQKVLLK